MQSRRRYCDTPVGTKSTRSYSTVGNLANKVREQELESQWKQMCMRFDLARDSNTRSMQRLQQELLEKEQHINMMSAEIAKDLRYVKQKRSLLDRLSPAPPNCP
eukprot:TRINITY_DN16226_c0_g1_i2.p1 TRINITY_DN16226_c0_g1~~TRINITY_DN16226_c0_g1_i2.p1  ORF type:complete len:104 (+),score=9.67 TRINITY_DN16226_c0_g1_i2:215-526(+)